MFETYFYAYELSPENRKIGTDCEIKLNNLKMGKYEAYVLVSKNDAQQLHGDRKLNSIKLDEFSITQSGEGKTITIKLGGEFKNVEGSPVKIEEGDGVALRLLFLDQKKKGLDIILLGD
ncbi:MAG TPA: hypothetical protein V6D00_04910 [Pantanalinema sp.]